VRARESLDSIKHLIVAVALGTGFSDRGQAMSDQANQMDGGQTDRIVKSDVKKKNYESSSSTFGKTPC
jgi:hypothetical protein